jgi:hypothetical protein
MSKKATHTSAVIKSEEQSLIKELHLLRQELRMANSWKHRLLWSVITGFGTVMGATVVVAIVLFILAQLASIELIRPFVEWVVHIVENANR